MSRIGGILLLSLLFSCANPPVIGDSEQVDHDPRYDEGFEEGKQEGLEEGREEGREEGLEEGREEGRSESCPSAPRSTC